MTNQSSSRQNGVVLTGASGFVGGALLKRLLKRDHDRPIVCLTRAKSDAHARVRGLATMKDVFGREPTRAELSRVEWVRADLEETQLGWDRQTWRRIGQQTDEIYHCAASVKLNLPLADAHRINVLGTQRVHELALFANSNAGRFRRFHHVSSAYAAGRFRGPVQASYLPPDRVLFFRNTFERTKARAERYLREPPIGSGRNWVPVSIYRPSLVTGDTTTGQTTSWNVPYVPMKLVARGQLPMFPVGGQQLVDTVGIDVVADGILALGASAQYGSSAFHIATGPTAFTVAKVLERTAELASQDPRYTPSRPALVSHKKWDAMRLAAKAATTVPRLGGARRNDGPNRYDAFRRCAAYKPYTAVNSVFDTTRERALMARYGVVQPSSEQYLDTILRYALATNFGRDCDTLNPAHEDRQAEQAEQVEPVEPVEQRAHMAHS